MTGNCNICKVVLDQEGNILTKDCGGDCMLCMARCGDVDCARELAEAGYGEFDEYLEDDDYRA
jgi:hypothetical protein